MAQHDYVLDNATGASFRGDLNNVLSAIASNNSGATEPSTTYAYQFWLDTSLSPARLKVRNSTNTAWDEICDYGRAQDLPYDNAASGLSSSNVKAALDEVALTQRKNVLHNGSMRMWQRGTTINAASEYPNDDDAYTADRWLLLSDGNDIVDVARDLVTVPDGAYAAMSLDVETANKKFGVAQIVETWLAQHLIGETVTLSFKAKVSATTNLDNVKAAIVSWSGTADSVTSDMISAWGSEGTNPTLAANWTFENTPADLNVTTSWATYSVTADVDTASTKNVAVLIWSDVTTTSLGEFLYLADVQLEKADAATHYEYLTPTEDLHNCQRFFQKSYASSTEPGTVTNQGAVSQRVPYTSATLLIRPGPFSVEMRATPSVVIYNPTTGLSGSVRSGTSNRGVSSIVSTNKSNAFTSLSLGSSAVDTETLYCHFVADAEL